MLSAFVFRYRAMYKCLRSPFRVWPNLKRRFGLDLTRWITRLPLHLANLFSCP